MRPIVFTKQLAAASANNIALSQSVVGAGNVTLNGSTVTGGVAVLDSNRQVLITSAGNDSGITFTVYGTAEGNSVISQTVTGANTSTVATTLNFLTVTRIATSGSTAAAITVGTNGIGASSWQATDKFITPSSIAIGIVVTGTVNYTVQYTYTDPNFGPTTYWQPAEVRVPTTFNDPLLTAATATGDTNFDSPIAAWRVLINSGTGSLVVHGIQTGMGG